MAFISYIYDFKICKYIKKRVFGEEFNKDNLDILRNPHVSSAKLPIFNIDESEKAYCFLYANPDLVIENEQYLDTLPKSTTPLKLAYLFAYLNKPEGLMLAFKRMSKEQIDEFIKKEFIKVAFQSNVDSLRFLLNYNEANKQTLISLRGFKAFIGAVGHNNWEVTKLLLEEADDANRIKMFNGANRFRKYDLFKFASMRSGDALKYLIDIAGDELVRSLMLKEYEENKEHSLFERTAGSGNVQNLERLIKLVGDEAQNIIAANNYAAFIEAAHYGGEAAVQYLLDVVDKDKVQTMLAASNFKAFNKVRTVGMVILLLNAVSEENKVIMLNKQLKNLAEDAIYHNNEALLQFLLSKVHSKSGHDLISYFSTAFSYNKPKIIQLILKHAGDQKPKMLAEISGKIFQTLANCNGKAGIINIILRENPELIKKAIAKRPHQLLSNAVAHFDKALIEKFLNLVDGKKIIERGNYNIIHDAFYFSKIDIANLLLSLFPGKEKDILLAKKLELFYRVASNVNILKYLLEKFTKQEQQEIILADNYKLFYQAARDNSIASLELLFGMVSEGLKQQVIKFKDFELFFQILKRRDLSSIKFLLKAVSLDKKKDMLQSKYSYIMREAAYHRDKQLVFFLLNELPLAEIKYISEVHKALVLAARRGNSEIVNILLMQVECFYYADTYGCSYNTWEDLRSPLDFFPNWYPTEHSLDLVTPFVDRILLELKSGSRVYTNEKDFKHGYCMLRHLIKRKVSSNQQILNNIRYLLDIPGIKRLAHEALFPGKENNLLVTALIHDNKPVYELLMAIPDVKNAADKNSYYIDIVQLSKNHDIIKKYFMAKSIFDPCSQNQLLSRLLGGDLNFCEEIFNVTSVDKPSAKKSVLYPV